jgi:Putative Ig domain
MRSLRTLPVPSLLIAALMLTGCGDGVVVSKNAAVTTPVAAVVPLELTGTPPSSVVAGTSYLFQPAVSQGGGVVTFNILGQPAWASFDAATGALTGTPAIADEGTTASITITGSNGSSNSSIGPFTIQVLPPPVAPPASPAPPVPPATGSASLSWTAPTENTDGTPITGLAGYHIYYGTSENALNTTITVADATQTSYVIIGLTAGTYYFAVVAYNSAGIDSADSNIVSKTI